MVKSLVGAAVMTAFLPYEAMAHNGVDHSSGATHAANSSSLASFVVLVAAIGLWSAIAYWTFRSVKSNKTTVT